MDQVLKSWIIRQFDQSGGEAKENLLRRLKFEPEKLQGNVRDNLHHWCQVCTVQTKQATFCDLDADPPEIMEALREHFKKELDLIT